MKMMLHLSLEGSRETGNWPVRSALLVDQVSDGSWSDEDKDVWSPRLRFAAFAASALCSWALVLAAGYVVWQLI